MSLARRTHPYYRYDDPSDHSVAPLRSGSSRGVWRKNKEKQFMDQMKSEFGLMQKSHGYSLHFRRGTAVFHVDLGL